MTDHAEALAKALAPSPGPFEARIVPSGMPTDCCLYGVVSLTTGREVCRVWTEADARAIATALAAYHRPAAEVVVKPLEWDGFRANSPVGAYSIMRADGEWNVLRGTTTNTWSCIASGRAPNFGEAFTQAKAAAQADYEARILSALAPVAEPAGEVVEAIADIAAERRRQIEAEGWTPEHDDTHRSGEMAVAAACYALSSAGFYRPAIWEIWPKSWGVSWFKPSDPRRNLVKAAALTVAEIERLDRAALRDQSEA